MSKILKGIKEIKRYFKATMNSFKIYTGLIIHCPKCKSLNIQYGETEIDGEFEIYPVCCSSCNARGAICELWVDGDVKVDEGSGNK